MDGQPEPLHALVEGRAGERRPRPARALRAGLRLAARAGAGRAHPSPMSLPGSRIASLKNLRVASGSVE